MRVAPNYAIDNVLVVATCVAAALLFLSLLL